MTEHKYEVLYNPMNGVISNDFEWPWPRLQSHSIFWNQNLISQSGALIGIVHLQEFICILSNDVISIWITLNPCFKNSVLFKGEYLKKTVHFRDKVTFTR